MTAPDRLMAGREVFSRAITLLLTRNGLSHAQLAAAASWANPDGRNWLSTSQISYYRTCHNKILGPKPAEALGQLNLALAMLAGDSSDAARSMEKLGRPPRDLAELLKNPFYLRNPETMTPMNAGDLFMVWIGRLVPFELMQDQNPDAATFSSDISRLCQDWFVSQGLPLREGMQQLLKHYPVRDQSRIERFQAVVAGLTEWTDDQVGEELEVLALTLGKAMVGHRFSNRDLLEAAHGQRGTRSRAALNGDDLLGDQ